MIWKLIAWAPRLLILILILGVACSHTQARNGWIQEQPRQQRAVPLSRQSYYESPFSGQCYDVLEYSHGIAMSPVSCQVVSEAFHGR